MTKTEIMELIDKGHRIDKEIKAKEKTLKAIKASLKNHAEMVGVKELTGKVAIIKFSDKKESEINMFSLWSIVKNAKKFMKMVKPAITEIKKELSSEQLEKVLNINTIEYASMKFIKK